MKRREFMKMSGVAVAAAAAAAAPSALAALSSTAIRRFPTITTGGAGIARYARVVGAGGSTGAFRILYALVGDEWVMCPEGRNGVHGTLWCEIPNGARDLRIVETTESPDLEVDLYIHPARVLDI